MKRRSVLFAPLAALGGVSSSHRHRRRQRRPGAPTLDAPTITGQVVTFTWDAPASHGSSAIVGYNVRIDGQLV